MTDTERLAEIMERCERATAGPWQWDEPSNWHGTAARVCNESYDPIAQVQMSGWPRKIGKANAAFIANARDDVPYLLALVDRLTAEVERLQDITCECGDAFDSRAKCVNCLESHA